MAYSSSDLIIVTYAYCFVRINASFVYDFIVVLILFYVDIGL